MAQYVNQSEQVIHGINAPVVNYGQIQVSKNLLDKMPVPDTDVGGKWTSAIPGAVASFGQGVMAGVKQRAAEADAQQKTALQNAKNEFAKVIRKYTAQQLQSGGPLSTYENNVRVAMDSFSGVVPEDDLYRIARDNSSGELTRAIEARKQLQKNEITDADTKVKDARSKYSWMQDWSYEDVLGFVTNQEYTKDNLFRYNGLYKSNNKDVSAFTMAVNSLADNLKGNFIQDANAFLEGEKDVVLDEAWLQEYKNNIKGVLVAAKIDPRIVDAGIDKGINASLLQTIVNGNEKLLNLTKAQQERELSLIKTGGELDFYNKNPEMVYVDLAIGTSGRQTIAQAKMMGDPDAKDRIEGLIQKAATSPITDPTERKQLIENDKVLPVYVKALRSKTEPMDNSLDSTLAYNVLGLMNTNNSSNPIKTEKDAETVIHNNSMLDLNSMKAAAEKLIKSGNPKDIEKGNGMLEEIAVNKSQTFAAKLVSPGYFSNANGLRKLLGSAQTYFDPVSKKVIEGENFLRFDPTTQEFYLAAPKGFIATSADKINNLTGLYEQYLKNANGLLKYAMQQDKDINGEYVAQFYDIPVQARNMSSDTPEIDADFAEMARQNDINWQNAEGANQIGTFVSNQVAEEQGYYDLTDAPKDIYNFLKSAPTNIGRGVNRALGNIPEGYYEWKDSLPEGLQNTRDYDLKGFYDKYGAEAIEQGQHLTDEFKKPNHITFSKESKYYKEGMWAGEWKEDSFNIPEDTPEKKVNELKKYFESGAEPGYKLKMGDKVLVDSEPITATATVSKSEPVGGASVESRQSLKFSDINWSPDMEMYSEIMESIESGGKADAVSNKGARGLMQLMPATYKDVAKRWNLPVDGINDPELNKIAGTLYLQEMLEKYSGDLEKAVAAYNWGPTALDKNIKKYGGSWRKHLPEETRNHVSKFLSRLYNGAW